jgi:uncharacterized phage protein (TIGR01671 family)
MRIHKYRAYNKKLKKMAQVIAIELDPELGGVEVWGRDHVSYLTGEHEADRDFWPWDDCVEMEYVGKADKIGKEIYEGDVVRVNGGEPRFEFVSHVIFAQAAFRVAAVYNQGFPDTQDIEVIGDIYRNPELAEEPRQAKEQEG